jgi:hypothetical protein
MSMTDDEADKYYDQWLTAKAQNKKLQAEIGQMRIQNIQMQAALGYGIPAEDERHIIPSNPYKCGTCDASKHLRAEAEQLRAAAETALKEMCNTVAPRNSFTDAVDALDAALYPRKEKRETT